MTPAHARTRPLASRHAVFTERLAPEDLGPALVALEEAHRLEREGLASEARRYLESSQASFRSHGSRAVELLLRALRFWER